MRYHSPWIVQLKRSRPVQRISNHLHPETVIVGGGIAGMATAYFLLRNTSRKVLLLEADKVAHGATGHNAGQVVAYFERPLDDIAREYGKAPAIEAYKDLIDTWTDLNEVFAIARLKTPLTRFTGYAGFSTLGQIEGQLRTIGLLGESGIKTEKILLAEEPEILTRIPSPYRDSCVPVPREHILTLLETKNPQFIAAFPEKKGCTNSSLLTEELAGFLLSSYPERFHLAEHTSANELNAAPERLEIKTAEQTKTAANAVLCTNGYKTWQLRRSPSSSPPFSAGVKGTVGYMNGYFDDGLRAATAIRYFTRDTRTPQDPYFYLTRRRYEHGRYVHDLICVGGPEISLSPNEKYNRQANYLKDAHRKIDDFVLSSCAADWKNPKPDFHWHGLMGYTESMIRLAGSDPEYPSILYNLGCNGVGILPSFLGGKRIARILAGEKLRPSIFDPGLQKGILGAAREG
jgi:glycine/D-amino acid oxidase-like deaminating enzyme